MGFRTTVVLYNDQASTWENDPELGKKIAHAMNFAGGRMNEDDKRNASLGYGKVVECAHADLNTLALISGYDLKVLGHSSSYGHQADDKVMMDLLTSAADKLGMKLIKKTVPKKRVKVAVQAVVPGISASAPQTAAAQALGIEAGTGEAVYLTSQETKVQPSSDTNVPTSGVDGYKNG